MEIALVLFVVVVTGIYFLGRKHGRKKSNNENVMIKTKFVTDYEDNNDKDSWEGGFWDAEDPKRLSRELKIQYVDANGNETEREIIVREFDNSLYGGILIAHCQLRDSSRTFRFDRVRRCIDLETGEEIGDIRKLLNDLYLQSPNRTVELLQTDYLDVLKTVYFVAKADGQYRKEEKKVISGYLVDLVNDDRLTQEMLDKAIKELAVPSIQSYKLAVGRVLKGGRINPDDLEKCCMDIVGTQSTVHPAEKEAIDYLSKKRKILNV